MKLKRSIDVCWAFVAFYLLGSSPAVAEDSVLKILRDRSEVVAHVKISRATLMEMTRPGEYKWRITGALQQVIKSHPEKKTPKTFNVVVTRIWRPGLPRNLRISIEKGREYLVFLKYWGKGFVPKGAVWALPYDTVLATELKNLKKADERTATQKKAAIRRDAPAESRQQLANQVICCGAFANVVSIKPLPKPLPKDYSFRGYAVDRQPKWMLTLNVEKHDRKIPMQPGIRRYYVADLKPVFQRTDVSDWGVRKKTPGNVK